MPDPLVNALHLASEATRRGTEVVRPFLASSPSKQGYVNLQKPPLPVRSLSLPSSFFFFLLIFFVSSIFFSLVLQLTLFPLLSPLFLVLIDPTFFCFACDMDLWDPPPWPGTMDRPPQHNATSMASSHVSPSK